MLKVSAPNGVKVYNVAGGKSLPEWLSEKKREALRKDEEFRRRIELIQELDFPCSSGRVKLSPDGQFLAVTGIHPPQVKVYELSQLALKFERHLLSEIIDFQILSDDYSKMVFACVDRSLVFHARFGGYLSMRLPKMPRSVTYHAPSADVIAVGSSSDVYRLNLEVGRFLAPLPSESPGLNVARVCPANGLLAAGGDDGALECFDLRSPVTATRLPGASAGGGGVTCLRFDDAGMTLAVGTHGGTVLLYDLRSSRPVLTKDHMYGIPMVDVKWHTGPGGERRVISSDSRIAKIWEASNGTAFTSIEPEADINDVCIWPGSGLVLMATEAKRLAPFFMPSLGPAPRWCAFLENLTEEMQEAGQSALYDDYRFVTRPELDRLGLTSAIGTPVLRAYMHGFFIDNRLYGKASALAAPFDYGAYRAQKVKDKLEAERASHIAPRRKLPKVNAALAARLLASGQRHEEDDEAAERANADGGRAEAAAPSKLLHDERFAALFSDTDFAVDEADATYKALHPNAPPTSFSRALLEEHFEAVDGEDDGPEQERRDRSDRAAPAGGAAAKQPRMFAARGEAEANAFAARQSLATERTAPLGARARDANPAGARTNIRHGAQEITFIPGSRDSAGRDGGGRGRGRGGGRGEGRGGGRGRDGGDAPGHKRRRMQFGGGK